MDRFNSISPLRHCYKLEILVNDDLLGVEKIAIEKDGSIQTRYAGKLKAIGYSSKQLAVQIRNIILRRQQPPLLRLPESVRADPLVRVKVTGRVPDPVTMNQVSRRKITEPGDFVRIAVHRWLNAEYEQKVAITGEVAADGDLLKVAGMTHYEAAQFLQHHIQSKVGKNATVLVYSDSFRDIPPQEFSTEYGHFFDYYNNRLLTVCGRVRDVGSIILLQDEQLTISDLIKMSGGFTHARPPKVRIIRKTPLGDKSIQVHAKAVWSDKNSDYDIFVRPHDVIIVE